MSEAELNELEIAEAHVSAEEEPKEEPKKRRKKGQDAANALVDALSSEPAAVLLARKVATAAVHAVEHRGPHVYQAISEVKKILARSGGITKTREAKFGERYQFRGIDDMYNVLCGVTADAGLLMIPRVTDQRVEREQRASGNGFQTHVWLTVEVDFVSTHDGSMHTGCFVGEAIDTSDKASNKAISAAFKYAHITVFQIPTHGESDDTENHNHEVAPPAPQQPPPPKPTPAKAKEFKVTAAAPVVVPPLDMGDAAIDWQIALARKIAVSDSFAALLAMAKEADPRPEPARGVIFQKIYERTDTLICIAPTMKALQESKGLIQALGSPAPLLASYNGRYLALRSAPPTEPAT